MDTTIELKNLVRHEKETDEESAKLEVNDIDKSEEINSNETVKCTIAGIFFLIIFIILSIFSVNHVFKEQSQNINHDKGDQNVSQNQIPLEKPKQEENPKENENPKEKENPKQKPKEEENPKEKEKLIEKENPKEKPKEEEKPQEKEKLKEIKKPNLEKPKENSDARCSQYDPINMINQRLKSNPIILAQNENSKHICFKEKNGIYEIKNGYICKMENIVLDPSKRRETGLTYKGPVDFKDKGFPLLHKGFFNMKSKGKTNLIRNSQFYHYYFDGWNYDYPEDDKNLEELAPGKTIFFISRNQDSPNFFHGASEFINALALMYLLNLDPEKIQVIFLESIVIKMDPLFELYKNIISRGGEPFHIRSLNKKYKISSAIHVPINWDSPCFIRVSVPHCQYPTFTYKYFNTLIHHYMEFKPYNDSFISDNDIYYYPKSVIEHHKQNKSFKKIITFQWRRVWPRGRSSQSRILGNGPELAEKLSKALPEDYLIRLIDTGGLTTSEQISLMLDTDYFIGVHGAGLVLGIFTPLNCIFHEILTFNYMNWLVLMGELSGHITFTDVIEGKEQKIEGSQYLFFNEDAFVKKILQRMKETSFI